MPAGSGVSIGEIYGRLFLVDDLSPALGRAIQNLSAFQNSATQFANAVTQTSRGLGVAGTAATQFSSVANTTSRALSSLANSITAVGQAGGAAGGGIGAAGAAANTAGGHARAAGGFFDQLGVRLFGVVAVSHLAADAIKGLAGSMVNAIGESAKLAARVEMLQGIAVYMARQQGYTAEQTNALAEAMRAQGITSRASFEGIAQLVRVNIDLSNAQKLAAIAQNTARIANLNSSETYERLIHAIVTQNSRILHTIGLNITLASAVKSAANETGKSIQQMTQEEKQQTMLNAIYQQAIRIQGVYGETNEFVGGRLLTMQRLQEEANLSIGKHFLAAMRVAVDGLSAFYKWVQKNSDIVVLFSGSIAVLGATMGALAFSSWIAGLTGTAGAMAALAKAWGAVQLVATTGLFAGGATGALAIVGFGAALGLAIAMFSKLSDSLTGASDALLTFDEKVVKVIGDLATLGLGGTGIARSFAILKGNLKEMLSSFGLGKLFGDDFSIAAMVDSFFEKLTGFSVRRARQFAEDLAKSLVGARNNVDFLKTFFGPAWSPEYMAFAAREMSDQFNKNLTLGDVLKTQIPALGSMVADLVRSLASAFTGSGGDFFKAAFADLSDFGGMVATTMSTVGDFFAAGWGKVKGLTADAFTSLGALVADGIDSAIQKFYGSISGMAQRIGDVVRSAVAGMGTLDFAHAFTGAQPEGGIKDIFSFATDGLSSAKQALQSISDAFDNLRDTAQAAAFAIRDTWRAAFGDTLDRVAQFFASVGDASKAVTDQGTEDANAINEAWGALMSSAKAFIQPDLDTIAGWLESFKTKAMKIADDIKNYWKKLFPQPDEKQDTGDKAAQAIQTRQQKILSMLAQLNGHGAREAAALEILTNQGKVPLGGRLTPAEVDSVLKDTIHGLIQTGPRVALAKLFDLDEEGLKGTFGKAQQMSEVLFDSFKKTSDQSKTLVEQYDFVFEALYTNTSKVKDQFRGLGDILDTEIRRMDKSGQSTKDIAKNLFGGMDAKEWKGEFKEDVMVRLIENRKKAMQDLAKSGESEAKKFAESLSKAQADLEAAAGGTDRLAESQKQAIFALRNYNNISTDHIAVLVTQSTGIKTTKDDVDSFVKAQEEAAKISEANREREIAAWQRWAKAIEDSALRAMEAAEEWAKKGIENAREVMRVTNEMSDRMAQRQMSDANFRIMILKREAEARKLGTFDPNTGQQLTKGYEGPNALALQAAEDYNVAQQERLIIQDDLIEQGNIFRNTDVEGAKATSELAKAAHDAAYGGLIELFRTLGDISGGIGGFFEAIGSMIAGLKYASEVGRGASKELDPLTHQAKDIKTHFGPLSLMFDDTATKTARMGAAMAVAAGIAGGAINVWKATGEAASKMGRAIGGLTEGMKAGAQVAGVWGAVIGGAIGFVVGLFRKPGFVDVMKRVGREWGVTISEELAKSIELDAKNLFRGNRQAAEIFNIEKIIDEAGGLNNLNLDKFVGHLRDVFSMLETGVFTAAQAMGVLEKNWNDFAKAGTDATGALADSLRELLRLAGKFGTITQSMRDYIQGQISDVQEAWNNVIAAGTEGFDKLVDNIDDAKEKFEDASDAYNDFTKSTREKFDDKMFNLGQKLKAPEFTSGGELTKNSQEIADAMAELGISFSDIERLDPYEMFLKTARALNSLGDEVTKNRLGLALFGDGWQDLLRDQAEADKEEQRLYEEMGSRGGILKDQLVAQAEAARRNKDALENMGIVAVGVFGAALASGKSFFDSLTAASPGLKNLKKAFENLNLKPEDAGLRGLLMYETVLEKTPALLQGIQSIGTAITGLANVNMLSPDTFARMQRTAVDLYTRLQGEIHNAAVEMGDFGDHTADALIPMQDTLHAIVREAGKLGLPIDAATQELIDQSKRMGIWKDDAKSDIERTEEAFEGLSETVKGLARDISNAMGSVGTSIVDAIGKLRDLLAEFRNVPGTINTNVHVTHTDDGGGSGGGNTGGGGNDSGRGGAHEFARTGEAATVAATTVALAFDTVAIPALERTERAINDIIEMHSPTGLEGIAVYSNAATDALSTLGTTGARQLSGLSNLVNNVTQSVATLGDAALTDVGAQRWSQISTMAAQNANLLAQINRQTNQTVAVTNSAATKPVDNGPGEPKPIDNGPGKPKYPPTKPIDLLSAAMQGSRSLLYTFARYRDVELARMEAVRLGRPDVEGGSRFMGMLNHMLEGASRAFSQAIGGGYGKPATFAWPTEMLQQATSAAVGKWRYPSGPMDNGVGDDAAYLAAKYGNGTGKFKEPFDKYRYPTTDNGVGFDPTKGSDASLATAATSLGLVQPGALALATTALSLTSQAIEMARGDYPSPRMPVPTDTIVIRDPGGDGSRRIGGDVNTTLPVPTWSGPVDFEPSEFYHDPPVPREATTVIVVDGNGMTKQEMIDAALAAHPRAMALDQHGIRTATLNIVAGGLQSRKRSIG